MDASSSMLVEDVDDGGSRMESAKRAGRELVESLPDEAHVGMLVYGARESDAPENREAACRDVETVTPVGRLDRPALVEAIDGIEPRGYTPIGESLRAAAEEFVGDGERSVVLVSDGHDTCAPPDPCEVAAELADDDIDLTVHTVGFLVDDEARAQLECIADRTGGEYREAGDAASLSESMRLLTLRAIEDYRLTGTEFEFSDSPESADRLGQGLYQSSIGAHPGTTGDLDDEYFALTIPEGHRAHVSVTTIPGTDIDAARGGDESHVFIRAVNSGEDCRFSPTSNNNGSDQGHVSAGGYSPPKAAYIIFSGEENCPADQWAVSTRVSTGGGGDAREATVPVEVSVQLEPIVDEAAAEGYPEGVGSGVGGPQVDSVEPEIEEPAPVRGGLSFNDATAVEPGSYSDSLVPGESRFYSVPVDWGQRPVVTLRTGPSDATRNAGPADVRVERIAFNLSTPMRRELENSYVAARLDVSEDSADPRHHVHFRNNEIGGNAARNAVAGDFYLAVSMNYEDDVHEGVEHPFEFAIDVVGEPEPGPDWRPVNEPGPPPNAEPGAAADDAGGEGDPADSEQAAGGEADGVPWTWVGLGGLAVVALLVGAVLAVRRRGGAAQDDLYV